MADTTALATVPVSQVPDITDRDLYVSDETIEYAEASTSESTRRAYASDMRCFAKWAEAEGRKWLPATPETVAEFLKWQADAGMTTATIQRRLSSISVAHRRLGVDNPTRNEGVKRVHKGIRRQVGTNPPNVKQALGSSDLRSYFAQLNGDLRHARDRALLSWGLSGAFRRGELVALTVEDLEVIDDGFRVLIRRSKVDQEGAGFHKVIVYGRHPETCPVLAMRVWLERAGISEGPLFRPIDKAGQVGDRALAGAAVADLVKRCAAALGKNPRTFAAHSLRRGFVTESSHGGAQIQEIMEQTGHQSFKTVKGYLEASKTAQGNAVTKLGL